MSIISHILFFYNSLFFYNDFKMLLQKMKDMKLLILLILTGKQFSEHFNLIVCMCVLYDNNF